MTESALTLLRPIASPKDMLAYHGEVTELIKESLKEGTDYGTIEGTDKPTLYKAGAERLCLAFGSRPTYEILEKEFDHDKIVPWTKRKKQWNNKTADDKTFTMVEVNGSSYGAYRYVVLCQIKRPDGRILGEGIGSCSSYESKYIDRPRDSENTILKMAQKRALIAATVNAFALSDRFKAKDAEKKTRGAAQQAPTKTFDGSGAHVLEAKKLLVEAKIPSNVWDETLKRMIGKFPDELIGIAQAVMAEYENQELNR